jgi:hypothetical protein
MMETKSWHTTDKSKWGLGDWQDEPDKMQWQDEATGLPCLIVRGPHGGLCGYVGVAPGHPLHGLDYGSKITGVHKSALRKALEARGVLDLYGDDLDGEGVSPDAVLDAHGGITFADGCTEITPETWKQAKAKLPSYRAQAERFPQGDAAEYLREFGDRINDYETWREHRQQRAIYHIPAAGEPDNVWWFGFDCAHSGDLSPKYDNDSRFSMGRDGVYRNIAYVQKNCRELAKQLSEIGGAKEA